MARNVSLAVFVEIVELDTGHWCSHCNLSTGVRACYTVTVLGETSLLAEFRCRECGNRVAGSA